MGTYNPDLPFILGQEWVGIRDEDLVFSPSINVVEYGHTFIPTTGRALSTGKFYIHEFPDGAVGNQTILLGVYPTGREALSGPIQSVVIPCSNTSATGTVGDGTIPQASFLLSPGDSQYIATSPSNNANPKTLDLYFGASQFSQVLAGKRIVKVELLHQLSWTPINPGTTIVSDNPPFLDSGAQNLSILQTGVTFANAFQANYSPFVTYFGCGLNFLGDGIQQQANAVQTAVTSINFGEVHPLSGATLGRPGGRYPWRYEDLANFEVTSGLSRLAVHYEFGAATQNFTGTYYLGYAALRVWYCEETRVAYAGEAFGGAWTISPRNYVFGSNAMTFVDTSRASNPILQPGQQYTVTVSAPDIGDIQGAVANPFSLPATSNAYPTLSALRELSTDPAHVGYKINLTQTEGDNFTREVTHILPQISLHLSGSSQPLPEPHVYGRQAVARVYGNVTATQNLLDAGVGANQSFPWARYYARRFGNTVTPLTLAGTSPTVSGSSVSISASEFDALPEIIDGWKEITLRFTNSPVMGAGVTPSWAWSATGELPGNRWEVLGVTAPALSGTPTSLITQDVVQLGSATYGQPAAGTTVELGWAPGYSVPVSGTTLDATSDAVLIFSPDMPAVSGFTVTVGSQPLTGVAQNCASYPWYVPSALSYNQLSWTKPAGYILDTFSTPAVSGWSPADTGQTWTPVSPDIGSYSVSGGVGNISIGTRNIGYVIETNLGTPDQDETIFIKVPGLVTGANSYIEDLRIRKTDDNNTYFGRLQFTTTSTVVVSLFKVVASVGTSFGSFTLTYVAGHTYGLRVSAIGNQIRLKAWDATISLTEPGDWQLTATDSSLTTGNKLGLFALLETGTTNALPFIVQHDNLQSDLPFGFIEIQRMDTISTDWATIAHMSSPATTGFNDYEARVGIQSSYRIRGVNNLNFAGPWSSTITSTFAAPGVTGTGMSANARTLLFTSNQAQNGARNLAYAIAADDSGSEGFNFPEAGFTQFQFMYGRDYQTAFRPLERGGVTFNRTVLVQAAAIPAPTLENFTSLRDLAWDSLPYVCVRDEDGNRWFSNVLVPQGKVMANNRNIYLADLTITQVTNTPAITEA